MMRIRTLDKLVQGEQVTTNTAFNGTVTTTTAYPRALITGDKRVTSDVITPNFNSRKQRGEVINNPFVSNYEALECSYGPAHARRNSGSGSTIRDYQQDRGYAFPVAGASGPEPSIDIDALKILSATECASRVDQSVVQGLVEIAEFHKLMDLFKVKSDFLALRLDNILKAAARRRLLRHGVRFFANNWLKYRYGILPAMHSLESVLTGLGKTRPLRQTARGSESQSNSTTVNSINDSGNFWTMNFAHHLTRDVKVRTGILYETSASYDKLGLRLTDVPSAMWELIPYSFVADWAINMGDYIGALSPKIGVRVLAQWTTTIDTINISTNASASWKSPSGFSEVVRPFGYQIYSAVRKHRYPKLETGLSLRYNALQSTSVNKRVIDSFALVMQKLLR